MIKVLAWPSRLQVGLIFLILFGGSDLGAQSLKRGVSQITRERMEQYIGYLASDSMKGRNTPSPELDLAARTLAGEMASLGLEPLNGSYFQEVPLHTRNLVPEDCLFILERGGDSKSFRLKTEYTPFDRTADTLVQAPLVFAGYGITAPEYDYDDYREIDVKGKVVLVMKHEPGEKDAASRFEGVRETRHSLFSVKLERARAKGAVGLLLVTDPLNHMLLTPQGYPWPGLSEFLPQDNLPIELSGQEQYLPCAQIGESVVEYLFGSVDSLRKIQQRIDSSGNPFSFAFTGMQVTLRTALEYRRYSASNVAGMIGGRHPRMKKEFVVIGGHYDHVGTLKNYREGEDYIFNGADDNASGTAGVMAVARAFAAMKKKPARSLLFLLFAGEEKGLFGSIHYCGNPLVPLENSTVMLNLDMISRNGADTVEISGVKQNPGLAEILLREADNMKLVNRESDEDLFSRSDHYNFYKRGIPAVNITTGLHEDYHKVSDDPASADPQKAATVAELTFRTAWKLANGRSFPLKIRQRP